MKPARALGVIVLWMLMAACGRARDTDAEPPKGRESSVAPANQRVVSVGGALTEIVFALGMGQSLVAVDTSSTYPAESIAALPKVGYQRTLSAEGIIAQRPTLLLLSSEAGPPSTIEQLRSLGVATHIVPADATVEGAKERVRRVAEVLGRVEKGRAVMTDLVLDLERSEALVRRAKTKPRVLLVYARGAGVLMVSGARTAAAEMIRLAGGENAVEGFDGFKPLTAEAVSAARPDVIVIPAQGLESVGGIAGLLAQPGIGLTPAGKSGRVVAIDDLLLLGFGPRLGRAVYDLAARIHPDLANETP